MNNHFQRRNMFPIPLSKNKMKKKKKKFSEMHKQDSHWFMAAKPNSTLAV